MKSGLLTLFLLILIGPAHSQEIEVLKFADLQQILSTKDSKVRVVNFWATWCKPCIEELPQFEALSRKYAPNEVEVILVSMDFAEEKSKVVKFAQKRGLAKSRLLLLDETDYNAFIDKISPEWSGAIPATLLLDGKTGKKAFFEKQFKEGELQQSLNSFMN